MNILFRADASVAIGTGHVMRCLALAQAWQDDGGRAIFAMAEATPAVEQRLQRENVAVFPLKSAPGSGNDAGTTAALAAKEKCLWVAVDGYRFGSDYQAALQSAGHKVLFIDDKGHAGRYVADVVVNQNAYADATMYPQRESNTRLLLGPQFAMLRREFAPWRGWKRKNREGASHVLVTMGGSDPDNFTKKAVEGIRGICDESVHIRVLAGGSNPHIESLEALLKDSPNSIQLVRDATDMPEQMSWADVAVAGAGSVCLEMCLMGLPALLVDLAENQTPIAREFERRGAAFHLGNSETVRPEQVGTETRRLLASPAQRSAMSECGRELVDGKGSERVVRELLIS